MNVANWLINWRYQNKNGLACHNWQTLCFLVAFPMVDNPCRRREWPTTGVIVFVTISRRWNQKRLFEIGRRVRAWASSDDPSACQALFFLRVNPTKPIRPEPKSQTAEGIGTGSIVTLSNQTVPEE